MKILELIAYAYAYASLALMGVLTIASWFITEDDINEANEAE